MSVDHCEPWSDNRETDPDSSEDFPYSAGASFEFPVSADTLFLISRSLHQNQIYSYGQVNYSQSEEVSDSIKVGVTAFFWHEEYLDASKACLLKRDNDQTGVGIFASLISRTTTPASEYIYRPNGKGKRAAMSTESCASTSPSPCRTRKMAQPWQSTVS
jgi:hypothetical protein